jgi:hypothetical protein
MGTFRLFVNLCCRLSNPTVGESVEAISRREILQQGKFAPGLLKAREGALELEARKYEEEFQ